MLRLVVGHRYVLRHLPRRSETRIQTSNTPLDRSYNCNHRPMQDQYDLLLQKNISHPAHVMNTALAKPFSRPSARSVSHQESTLSIALPSIPPISTATTTHHPHHAYLHHIHNHHILASSHQHPTSNTYTYAHHHPPPTASQKTPIIPTPQYPPKHNPRPDQTPHFPPHSRRTASKTTKTPCDCTAGQKRWMRERAKQPNM